MVYDDAYIQWYQNGIELAAQMQSYAVELLTGLGLAYFVRPFMSVRTRRLILAGLLYAVSIEVIAGAGSGLDFDIPRWATFLLRTGIVFSLLYLSERRYPRQKLFLALTYYSLTIIFIGMTSDQYNYFSDALFSENNVKAMETLKSVLLCFVIADIEFVGVYTVLLCLGIYFLHRAYGYKEDEISIRDLLLLSIPSVSQAVQMMLYSEYYRTYADYFTYLAEHDEAELVQQLSWGSWTRFFAYLVQYLIILALVWIYSDMRRAHEERLGEVLISEQTRSIMDGVRRAEESYEEMRRVRHDIRHHLTVIEGLLDRQEYDEAASYLADIEGDSGVTDTRAVTGHPVTDVIIADKMSEARKRHATLISHFFYPEGRGIDVVDLSVLLGNAINNALEAVPEDGEITVRSNMRGHIYMLEVRNTFHGSWRIPDGHTLPVSSKAEPGHGLGLSNMQRIAAKYRGDLTLERDDDEAVLTVLLQA